MKKSFKYVLALIVFVGISAGLSSCVVVEEAHGNHKGWFKNTHNPHHPFSNNPGHAKHKHKHHK